MSALEAVQHHRWYHSVVPHLSVFLLANIQVFVVKTCLLSSFHNTHVGKKTHLLLMQTVHDLLEIGFASGVGTSHSSAAGNPERTKYLFCFLWRSGSNEYGGSFTRKMVSPLKPLLLFSLFLDFRKDFFKELPSFGIFCPTLCGVLQPFDSFEPRLHQLVISFRQIPSDTQTSSLVKFSSTDFCDFE